MAPAKYFSFVLVVQFDEAPDGALFVRQLSLLAVVPENTHELLCVGTAEQHLVLNAAKKSLVTQLLRLQVGRKDEKRFERNRHLAAREKFQIIHAPLHGHD